MVIGAVAVILLCTALGHLWSPRLGAYFGLHKIISNAGITVTPAVSAVGCGTRWPCDSASPEPKAVIRVRAPWAWTTPCACSGRIAR